MASNTTRQASSLLSISLRPRSVGLVSKRAIAPAARRYVHENSENASKYERQPTRLPYSNPEYIQNARPQPRAPVAPRARKHFQVNDDPAVLNRMYLKLFGKEMGLSEEVKWQAVTHKSFDHGRQPFNSKLRFFGKRLLQMHASLSLLNSQPTNSTEEAKPTVYKSLEGAHYQNPEPFVHEDFKNIDAVTQENIEKALDSGLLMPIIKESGLADVMRWKPADGNDLLRSGQGIIAIECFHAIVGALALQKGGEVAAQFIKEKVLKAQ